MIFCGNMELKKKSFSKHQGSDSHYSLKINELRNPKPFFEWKKYLVILFCLLVKQTMKFILWVPVSLFVFQRLTSNIKAVMQELKFILHSGVCCLLAGNGLRSHSLLPLPCTFLCPCRNLCDSSDCVCCNQFSLNEMDLKVLKGMGGGGERWNISYGIVGRSIFVMLDPSVR